MELKMIRFAKHIKYFSIILLLSTFNNVWAYTMPVGIPNTDIDFEQSPPQRPSDWSNEVAGYYYIDIENGSYAAEFGSETTPRKYLPKPIPAGSYIEIAGNYNYAMGGVIPIFSQGTNDDWVAEKSGPVWITQAKNKQGAFTEYKVVVWGDNVFLTGMTLKDESLLQVGSSTIGYPAKNIVIRDNEITGWLDLKSGALLSSLGGSAESTTEDVIFYNNLIRDAGDISSPKDLDAGIISIAGYTSNVWVLSNTGYNASGGGIQVNAGKPREATHNIYIGNNEFYNVRQSGLWVKFAQDVVFSSNYIHDIISTPWSPSKGIGGQYEPDGLWIINNRIHDVEYGIRIPSTYDVGEARLKIYAIGNIIYNINTKAGVGTDNNWESAAIHLVGAHEHYIYNNLIFNAPNGINLSGWSQTAKTIIENNIIFDLKANHSPGESGYHIWSEGKRDNETILISNNYFDSNMKVRLVNDIYDTPELLTTTGNLNNSKGPIFISNDNINSIIDSGTTNGINSDQLEDKGKDVSSTLMTIFKHSFPETNGINLDFLNNPRNLGDAIDIGPFEQDGIKKVITIPEKPTNIGIILVP
jgi:hypothetical protein